MNMAPYVVHRVGRRFALAEDAHAYLVVPVHSRPGGPGPLQVFPRDPIGWEQAVMIFGGWEPEGRPAGPQDQPSPFPVAPAPYGPTGHGSPPPYYGPPAPGYGPVPQQRSGDPVGIGVAGGVVGIVGTVLSLIPLVGIVLGLLLGPLAIILSSVGLAQSGGRGGRPPRPTGMAVTGLVLGILTVIFKLIPGVNLL